MSTSKQEHDSNKEQDENLELFNKKGIWVVSRSDRSEDLRATKPRELPTSGNWRYYYEDHDEDNWRYEEMAEEDDAWHNDPLLIVVGVSEKPS